MKQRSLLKGLKVGDLVYYRIRPANPNDPWKWNSATETGAAIIDRRRHGLIVALDKKTAMGFQMVKVLWNDTTEIDSIAENYLHKIDENKPRF